jgi:large repetitive protein
MLVSVKRLVMSSSFLIILAASANIPYNTALAIINTAISNDTVTSNNISNVTSPNDTSSVQLTPLSTANHPPVANAGTDQIVNENTTVTLVGAGSDPDPDDTLAFLWRQTGGPSVELSNRTSTNPAFTAPMITDDTQLKFSLGVTDDKGLSSSPAVVNVAIRHINRQPIANAGQDQTVNAGHAVSLDGTGSKDPDSDVLSYSWNQTNGPSVKLDDTNTFIATFRAPSNISSDTDLIFELKTKDGSNATSTDDAKVTVKYVQPSNKPPLANAGPNQTVNASDIVKLDGTASSDPDGNITTYLWKQTDGPAVSIEGTDTTTPLFTAPSDLTADTDLTFKLTVTDDRNGTSYDDVKVIVKYVPLSGQPSVTSDQAGMVPNQTMTNETITAEQQSTKE